MTMTFAEIQKKNETDARNMLEALRWPNGPFCPHCGSTKTPYTLTAKPGSKTPVRDGVYKCADCRQQFTVTVGTIFEDSRIPLQKWLTAIYLMSASKKGMSAHQIHRMIGITYKSAWFMCHRIRYAMEQGPLLERLAGVVEVDETYVGGKPRGHKNGKHTISPKTPVMVLVERNGNSRAMVVKDVDRKSAFDVVKANVEETAHLMTDASPLYHRIETDYPTHSAIDHNKEYVNGNIHINTAEGWFALLKRGVMGTFHHISEQHTDRYCAEFEFRYDRRKDKDGERAEDAIEMSKGKRLYYKSPTHKDESLIQQKPSQR